MTSLPFSNMEKEEVDNDVVEVKAENVKNLNNRNIKAPYTLNRTKKLRELQDNLKRTNIVEENVQEDLYTFKIEPGCYSEIAKKMKQSTLGDEINDESVDTENPVGIKMKLTAAQGLEDC